MIKIGELSKICRVSVQTLRYYDKLGLLCADYVDQSSGYRYYKPEKIQTYQTVARLKELGFTLEEIKLFLDAESGEQLALFTKKKRDLEHSIRKERNRIQQIDDLCRNPQKGILADNAEIWNYPFEDDPSVIGKWEYCGRLPNGERFSGVSGLIQEKRLLPCLFFLPGGGHVWTYFWTRGIVYWRLIVRNIWVPNTYRVFSWNGETYLSLDWMVDKCLDEHAQDCILIFRQVDQRLYTEKQTFLFTDNVDVPYREDARVLGEWEVFDCLYHSQPFSVVPHIKDRHRLYVQGLEFFGRGNCFKLLRGKNGTSRYPLLYSAGCVLDREMGFSEHYEIRTVGDEDYLILEHKNGDYAYLGKVMCHYVFKRKQPICELKGEKTK